MRLNRWTAVRSSAGRLSQAYEKRGLLESAGIRSAIPPRVEELWPE